jgi:hypothetical protein
VLILVTVWGLAVARALGSVRTATGGDPAAVLLKLATRSLPAERGDWGLAMCTELDQVRGGGARLRFALGCVRATLVLRFRALLGSARQPDGAGLRALVAIGIAVALALAAYGLVHYPGLRSGDQVWASVAASLALLAVLFGYAMTTLALSRGPARRTSVARRHGLAGGVVTGAGWLAVVGPVQVGKTWMLLLLVLALAGPAGAGALAARSSCSAHTGARAAFLSGLVGALLLGIVWVTASYADGGRPYDAGLLRDFHSSGAHDLVTYAVSEDLGGAIAMLFFVPTVALALGSIPLAGWVLGRRRAVQPTI